MDLPHLAGPQLHLTIILQIEGKEKQDGNSIMTLSEGESKLQKNEVAREEKKEREVNRISTCDENR